MYDANANIQRLNNTKYLDEISLNSLTEGEITSINGPITVQEIDNAIKKLKAGKAPGPDGFNATFYNTFMDTLR